MEIALIHHMQQNFEHWLLEATYSMKKIINIIKC